MTNIRPAKAKGIATLAIRSCNRWDDARHAETVRLRNDAVDGALAQLNGRQLVIVTRDAHRNAWECSAVEHRLAHASDAVVVEVGLPYWKPDRATTYITTHGAGRVNVEAAAERYTQECVAGWSSLVARRAHNPEVAGSNPAPATGKALETGLFCSLDRDRRGKLLPNFCLWTKAGSPLPGQASSLRQQYARTR